MTTSRDTHTNGVVCITCGQVKPIGDVVYRNDHGVAGFTCASPCVKRTRQFARRLRDRIRYHGAHYSVAYDVALTDLL